MFIELTEFLRCPNDHEETHAVCLPLAMEGRDVRRGVVGCPTCRAEYAIVDGVADFADKRTNGRSDERTPGQADARTHSGAAPRSSDDPTVRLSAGPPGPLTADGLATILDLRGPGGFLLLVGAAARLGAELAERISDVHIVCVNAPADSAGPPGCSLLRSTGRLPLTTSSMRAVVLGADAAAEPWLGEGVRVLLHGLRFVAEDEHASPAGVAELARGAGLLVGEKRSR